MTHSVARYFERAAGTLPHLSLTFRLIWRAAPRWTLAWIFLLLIQGFLPVATVYLTRPVVNGIVAAVRSGGDWRPILVPAVLMAAVLLVGEALRGVIQWVRTVQADLVHDEITSLIHHKSIEADLGFYESPDFYDHLHRARSEAGYRPIALLETSGSLLQNGITLAAMLVVLAGFGVWLPLALLASTLPTLAVVLRHAVQHHDFRIRTTPVERRTWYYDWLLTTGETAPEIRLFDLGGHFREAYQNLRDRLRIERVDLARRQGMAQFLAGVSAWAVTGAALIWMVSRALRGFISLGDLALFYQAFQQGLNLGRTLLENVGQLYQNSLFLGNLFEFLELKPLVISPEKPVIPPVRPSEGIRFHNVTFRYPGTQKIALEDFNLTIPAGRTLAIVGPNGAGKSTLVKLLCRFYDPEGGRVTLDGTDLGDFSIEELRRRIAVLFQKPVEYNATVRENIRMGDLKQAPSDEEIRSAARKVGAENFIQRLPDGYDNLLGHWFEKGAQLSVGEWQRLGLARAFVREAPIVLLDEPTSAMDPWAEADWLGRLRRFAEGRTVVLITHRFTTAMVADEIHVMEQGRIVESGSHPELIDSGGRYSEWWAAQNSR